MDNIRKLFADPDADPVRFHSMVNALVTSLDQQSKDGQAAMAAYQSRSPDKLYIEYLKQKGVERGGGETRLRTSRGRHPFRCGRAGGRTRHPPRARPGPRQVQKRRLSIKLVPDIDTGMKLPSGTRFRTPDGKPWMVP